MQDVAYIQPEELTRREAKLRAELEARVFALVRGFYLEVGMILAEICEKRLYKSTHRTFAEYCADVLDIGARRAYQLIEAVEVAQTLLTENVQCQNVNNCSQNIPQLPEIIDPEKSNPVSGGANPPVVPHNEAQARALVGMEPDEMRRVWRTAVETAPDGRVTAAHIRRTARELKAARAIEATEKPKRHRSANKARMSERFEEAFNIFLTAINEEIRNNFKDTDRRTVISYLDGCRAALAELDGHKNPDPGYEIHMSNVEKLLAAGFRILRPDTARLIIEERRPNGDWVVVQAFQDVAALEAVFNDLMLEPTNIRG